MDDRLIAPLRCAPRLRARSSRPITEGVPETPEVSSIIPVSVTPFDQAGPCARHPATDLTISAAGGLLNMQGEGDRPPFPVGVPETAHLGSVQAAADTLS